MKSVMTIIRVSEEDQLKGYGPDVQSEQVERYLPEADLVEKERRVINEESTSWNRPRFEAILNEAVALYEKGEIAGVVFPRRNRLARYGSAGAYYLGLLDRTGLEIHFAKESRKYDPKDPESFEWVMRGFTQAQQDADEIRSNTMEGRLLRAKRDHKMPSGGHKWAFDYDPATGRYTKNEERAQWILRCDDWLLEEGCSLNECCRRLTAAQVMIPGFLKWTRAVEAGREWKSKKAPEPYKWLRQTLRLVLLDDANIGLFYAYRHKWVRDNGGRKTLIRTQPEDWLLVYEDTDQRIRSPERHEAIKARLQLNRDFSKRNNKKHWYPPLRGLVFCTLCGLRMHGVTIKGTAYYRCDGCKNHINVSNVWQELQDEVKMKLRHPSRLIPGVKAQMDTGQSLTRLEEEKARLELEAEKWTSARRKARRLFLIKPDYTEEKYLADDRDMERQEAQVASDLAAVEDQISYLRQAMVDEEGIRRFCEDTAQNLETMNDAHWRVLLERMKLRLEVTPGEKTRVFISLPPAREPECEIVSPTSPRYYRQEP